MIEFLIWVLVGYAFIRIIKVAGNTFDKITEEEWSNKWKF